LRLLLLLLLLLHLLLLLLLRLLLRLLLMMMKPGQQVGVHAHRLLVAAVQLQQRQVAHAA
jgi:hypothetical protein